MKREEKLQFLKDHPDKMEPLFFPIFRNVHIFLSFYGLNKEHLTKEQLTKKYNLSLSRINGIINDVWNFIDLPSNSKIFRG